MSVLNYFFIAFVFTFFVDYMLSKFTAHPYLKGIGWSYTERIICILIWPLCFLVFIIAFIKERFKK